jgi:ribose-phosphate pyrophosphokinase
MNLRIIGGSSHKKFTQAVCNHLGIKETATTSKLFSNGNRFITIEEAVRGDDVFVIQTQVPPVDTQVMELLTFIRALRDASAARITAVMPYMPYIRSDKKDQPRICITARLLADLLYAAGANRALIMDMHSPQAQGFFSTPCDHLLAAPEIVQYLKTNWDLNNYCLVAGDAGAAKMLKLYADGLSLPVAIMDKRREGNEEKVVIKGVIGNVQNRKVLLIDDETQTGGTLIKDAEYLMKEAGAVSVDACFVHAALGPEADEKLNNSPIKKFVTTDTIPLDNHNLKNFEVVSVTKKFAECIRRTYEGKSIKSLNDL